MAQLKYKDNVLNVSAGSTVLDTLLEHGHEVPNNCRAGACQSCMMQVTKGKVPERSQQGLKDSHKAKGLFLACSCEPEEDLNIQLPDAHQLRIPATVSQINKLSSDVIELKLKTTEPYKYYAGQYVTLWRDEFLGRSYSLASLPQQDETLNFHIKLIPNGMFSGWVHDELQVGDTLFVQGPAGDCFYTPENPQQNLLLIGTGTGLAPLYGIIHDALQQGHTGEIHLFHGALNPSGLYLMEDLSILEQQHHNIKYHPCVFNSEA
ncbi:MAG: 2Fe-2S iron-sulfur cluster binding domain-containing protein, partial [Gammaproteobacteria bacterium]|nr:2Fe-2S iron-sulfur cluster binding domain-containing protein [Gammaproteobacteria bacterium]